MKIPAKTEYACIAVLELAAQYASGEPVRVRSIVERHEVPPRFLVQILLQLKAAGLVDSIRGATGGYRLIRSPGEVSLGEVMEVIEGSSQERVKKRDVTSNSAALKVLRAAWHEVSTTQRQMLRSVSFSDLLERAQQQDEPVYHI